MTSGEVSLRVVDVLNGAVIAARRKCSTGLTSKAGATGTARGNFWSRFGRKCSVNRFYRKGA